MLCQEENRSHAIFSRYLDFLGKNDAPQDDEARRIRRVGILSRNLIRLVGDKKRLDLAEAAGFRQGDFSDTINKSNDQYVRLWTILRVARALNCSLDEVVQGLDPVYDAQRAAAAGVTSPVLQAGILDGPLEDLLAMPVDERIRRIACGLAMLEEPELASVYAEIRRIISTAAASHEPKSKEGPSR